MNRTFRNTLAAILLTTLILSIPSAYAALKVWSGSETIQVADLNSNFTQVNNSATALVTNSKVATGAAIATSKLAAYRYIPRTWVTVLTANAGCGTAAAACTELAPDATAVVGTALGSYTVSFATNATDTTYGVTIGIMNDGTVTGNCQAYDLQITGFKVRCRTDVPANADMGFTAVVYDDN